MASSLESGAILDRYRILEPLGRGGMGEVYKAWDATLERSVALKVLPPDLVANSDRLRRFVQEAKSASSLNHPHIVVIHDVGQARLSAHGDSAIHYIAMELIDGETLRRKIDGGAGARAIVGWLAQIADGLAKAHGAGIVHRDLKPDNIMIARDGYAKVLDFGLAKLVEPSAERIPGDAPTVAEATREGVIVGTAGYMSPEQIEAKPIDARSDIFSFGCILYEAATRRKPFAGSSDVDVMHRILYAEPAPMNDTNVPADLRRVIRRCLAKSPEQRIQSMKDVAIELHEIAANWEGLSSTSDPSREPTMITRTAPKPAQRRRWMPVAVAAVLVVLAAIAAVWGVRALRRPRFTLDRMKIARLTNSGNVIDFDLSPDGKYFVQEAVDDDGRFSVWLKQTATDSNVRIAGPSPVRMGGLAFTPGGDFVHFLHFNDARDHTTSLFRVATLGGAETKILPAVNSAPGFSADGKLMAFIRRARTGQTELIVANVDGSSPRSVFAAPAGAEVRRPPSWSPDGKRIAVAYHRDQNHEHVALIDAVTGAREQLGSAEWKVVNGLRWMPDGSGVVVTATPASGGSSQLAFLAYPGGDLTGLRADPSTYGRISVSADGKTLALWQETRTAALYAGDMNGQNMRAVSSPDVVVEQVANGVPMPIFTALSDGESGLWAADANGVPRQLTAAKEVIGEISATSDGKLICFLSRLGGRRHVYVIRSDGTGLKQLTNGREEYGASMSPDGRWFVYQSNGKWMRQAVAGGPAMVLADHAREGSGYTPDGKELVLQRWHEDANHRVISQGEFYDVNGKLIRTVPENTNRFYDFGPTSDTFVTIDNLPNNNVVLNRYDGAQPPKQLTHFASGSVWRVAFSADRKRMFVIQGERRRDVVTITDFR